MIWHELVKMHALDFPVLERKITIIVSSDFKLSVCGFKAVLKYVRWHCTESINTTCFYLSPTALIYSASLQ